MTKSMFGGTSVLMTVFAGAAAVAVAGVAVGSCGGDAGGSGVNTSIPGNKPLNTLTQGEINTLCMDIGRSFANDQQIQQGSCKILAFTLTAFAAIDPSATDAQLQAACNEGYNACVSGGGAADAGGAAMCTVPDGSCTATVAELTACAADSKVALQQSFSAIPACSAITRAGLDMGADAGTPMQSAGCMTFMTKSPGFNPIPGSTTGP